MHQYTDPRISPEPLCYFLSLEDANRYAAGHSCAHIMESTPGLLWRVTLFPRYMER